HQSRRDLRGAHRARDPASRHLRRTGDDPLLRLDRRVRRAVAAPGDLRHQRQLVQVTMRARRGFTLMEMTIVMAIMAVAASLIAPALVKFGAEQPAGSADKLLALLHDARETA